MFTIDLNMSSHNAEGNAAEDTIKVSVKSDGIGKRVGVIATCVIGGSLVALYAVAGPFVAPALRKICLPYVPATSVQIENVLKMLQQRSGTLVDIGSGDGRIVSNVNIFDANSVFCLIQLS